MKGKLLKTIKNLLIGIGILVVLTSFLLSFQKEDQAFSFFGYKALAVLSNSMKPSFEIGDVILIKEVPSEKIISGDIITSQQEGKLITHRVVDVIEGEGWKTKGDNNNVEDKELVAVETLRGKQVFTIKYVGYLSGFLKTKLGFSLFVALPLLLFCFLSLYEKIKGYKKGSYS